MLTVLENKKMMPECLKWRKIALFTHKGSFTSNN